MADLGLVKRLVDAGCERDAAVAQIEAVLSAIREQLLAGRSVSLDGLGVLKAPEAIRPAPYPPGKLRTERKVSLKGAVIAAGEPYDDLRPAPKKRRYFGNGVMS